MPAIAQVPHPTGWLRLCGGLAVGCAAAWALGNPASLTWHTESWASHPWTLWTASLGHLSGAHLGANLLALGAIAVLGHALRLDRPATVALAVAWPLSTLSLLLWPQVTGYSGLSGFNHAAVLVIWSQLAMKTGASQFGKPLAFALFIGAGIKLLTEHAWTQPVVFDPNWGFNVVTAAHLGGAVAGAVCGVGAAGMHARQPA